MFLDIALLVFIVMELANVIILYFKPDFRHGNSMAPFEAYRESSQNRSAALFHRYLVRWVVNCKLIFLVLLLVVVWAGSLELKYLAVIGTTISIGVYYLTLHPLILQMDAEGQIDPPGYSKTLGWMIAGFMILLSLAVLAQWFWS